MCFCVDTWLHYRLSSDSHVCGRPHDAIQHYCHLVFWTLIRRYLRNDVLQRIMGNFSSKHVITMTYKTCELWGTMDKKEFKLPVDADNIPTGVLLSTQTCACVVRCVEDVRKWNAETKLDSYTQQKKKIMLWKLKSLVAWGLCRTVPKEISAMAGVE